jgi:dTMP kinase
MPKKKPRAKAHAKARKKQGAFLITFEGTEGAGKSTLIRALKGLLTAHGLDCEITREPGGSQVAEQIRKVILENPMDPWTELFLYEASRAEHLAKTIRPALAAGKIVLCDRFTDSSLAYQGHARGLPWKEVHKLNRIATQGLKPDLTVLLDIDPAVGLSRASEKNRFEDEGLAFQKKVRQGFLKARNEEKSRWLVLKPAPPDELANRVYEEYLRRG